MCCFDVGEMGSEGGGSIWFGGRGCVCSDSAVGVVCSRSEDANLKGFEGITFVGSE